ncbi:hypothetical protein K2173_004365 [Erythroxylum novogranatense]|uniref:DUF4283 domain-containing protein n=1 Tax=Erythroxylum novogranatense TaxID=1862640 RepID=A0AAV8T5L2_9ROSI|nr:hypothetical protein K2173_004365 [Erythroxylum novogranatense]
MLSEDDSILFKFINSTNLDEIMDYGSWQVGEQPLFIQKWRIGLEIDLVQFHNVSMEFRTIKGLSYLARSLGKLICIDSQTMTMEHICYAKICVEVSKKISLLESLPILQLTKMGELEKVVITLSYPWKLMNDSKVWKPTSKLFQTRWHEELLDSVVVDDNDGAVSKDRGVVYESPLVKVDNHLSGIVDVVNSMVDVVECERVDVNGVVFDTAPVKAVKDSHSAEDESDNDATMGVFNDVVDVVNGGEVNLQIPTEKMAQVIDNGNQLVGLRTKNIAANNSQPQ